MLIIILAAGAALHFFFMAGEMFPWPNPMILAGKLRKSGIEFDEKQHRLVATIVRNAGIYNLILAIGFVWSCNPGLLVPIDEASVKVIRTFFLSGAVIAGLFGVSLSRFTLVQAGVGFAGLAVLHLL